MIPCIVKPPVDRPSRDPDLVMQVQGGKNILTYFRGETLADTDDRYRYTSSLI